MPSNRGQTAQRILAEAEALFAERGYRGTSLGEVADRVGIRGPSLFNHFKTKRDLYEAILERLLTPFFTVLEELATTPADPARTRAALARMMGHHAAHPNLACLIQQAVLEGGAELDLLIERWYRPFFAALPDLLETDFALTGAGEETAELGALIMAFNCMILGYVTLAPLHERLLMPAPLGAPAVDRYVALMQRLAVAAAPDASRS